DSAGTASSPGSGRRCAHPRRGPAGEELPHQDRHDPAGHPVALPLRADGNARREPPGRSLFAPSARGSPGTRTPSALQPGFPPTESQGTGPGSQEPRRAAAAHREGGASAPQGGRAQPAPAPHRANPLHSPERRSARSGAKLPGRGRPSRGHRGT
ncbi:hypothetical protein OY671_012163, partial [Metschnikowia pulcherrima]